MIGTLIVTIFSSLQAAPPQVYEAVLEAIRVGFRHIDCALAYHNESDVGRAIAQAIKEGIVSRDQLFITGKVSTG